MPLLIKTQGFPGLIEELGIQSPLQGPFWGFEPVVIPQFIIGSSNVQHISAMPYSIGDFASSVVVNPIAAQELVGSVNLPPGRYGFTYDCHFINTGAGSSAIDFLVITNLGASVRVIPVGRIGNIASLPANLGQYHITMVEDMNEGDAVSVRNQTGLGAATVTSSLKWIRINPLEFIPRF